MTIGRHGSEPAAWASTPNDAPKMNDNRRDGRDGANAVAVGAGWN